MPNFVSGGPSGFFHGPGTFGYLHVWTVFSSEAGHYPDDNSFAASSSAYNNCSAMGIIISAAVAWPQKKYQYKPGGPNSNTAAHFFGRISGLDPPPPPDTLGWDAPLK